MEFLSSPSQAYNCSQAGQASPYFTPMPDGIAFWFQTNCDVTELGIIDEDGTFWLVGYTSAAATINGQTICNVTIDSSTIRPLARCYYFRITCGAAELYTNWFERANPCLPLVKMESQYDCYDVQAEGADNYYGIIDGLQYKNTLYLYAQIQYQGQKTKTTQQGIHNFQTRTDVEQNYRIVGLDLLPDYEIRKVATVLAGKFIQVNDTSYLLVNELEIKQQKSCGFIFDALLTKRKVPIFFGCGGTCIVPPIPPPVTCEGMNSLLALGGLGNCLTAV